MRGEVWTMRDGSYASKARPVVIVQSDDVAEFDSVVLCLLTSFESSHIAMRVKVEPTGANGLQKTSWVMTDKIASVRRSLLGERIGRLDDETMRQVSCALAKVLGISV